ncbi:hypothetical protein LBMAG42_28300 [Deltaproteobacteria bacterium]|nr:hypothetical protein LBMAG42_28300 [Deltaproteobacteria bacterium]
MGGSGGRAAGGAQGDELGPVALPKSVTAHRNAIVIVFALRQRVPPQPNSVFTPMNRYFGCTTQSDSGFTAMSIESGFTRQPNCGFTFVKRDFG